MTRDGTIKHKILLALFATIGMALVVSYAAFLVYQIRRGRARDLTRAVASVVWIRGGVEVVDVSPDARPAPAASGASLHSGQELRTAEDGALLLRLDRSEVTVELHGNARLRLDTPERMVLANGELLGESGSSGGRAVILTALGEVRTVDAVPTSFSLLLAEAGLTVRVRTGRVLVGRRDVKEEVPAASELFVDTSGLVSRRTLPR